MRHQGAYPANWTHIALGVKVRAQWRCEKCDSPSVPGHILTVHHLDGDKSNCSDRNLLACCQVCHLHLQASFHPDQLVIWPEPWQLARGLGRPIRQEKAPC